MGRGWKVPPCSPLRRWALGLLLASLASFARAGGPLAFELSFPAALSRAALDGHIILILSKDAEREPRFTVVEGIESQQAFGLDVEALPPGRRVRIDGQTLGYPLESLRGLAPGEYRVQAVLNLYETFHLGNGKTVKLPPDRGEGQHWQTKPGNLLTRVAKLRLDPANSGVISLAFDRRVPPLEEQLAEVDSLLEWHKVTQPNPGTPNKWERHIRLKSERLSTFWGRPTDIGAVVLLPDGWEEHPQARYPVLLAQDHYHRHFSPAFRTAPPDPKAQGAEREKQEGAWRFFQDWTSGRFPRVILVMPQHPNPYFDDAYAVNSANLGPTGDAIMRELLPAIEAQFRGIAQGWARATFGGSTGGWEALATQVFYPDDFNGAWVGCPDPIDFRAYGTVNLYEDRNAYFREGPFMKVPLPEKRKANGILDCTMEQCARYELVLGTRGRSGEQWDAWQAVFSPNGEDGYPKPIWDKRTGVIDRSVAEYWRAHYDISHIMHRDWATLGPKLAGKIHVTVGDMDTWYLNNAVHLTEARLGDPRRSPAAAATFTYGPLQPHCYMGTRLDAPLHERLNHFSNLIWTIVKHLEDTAPAGADVRSWKY
ncbi:alpha/beta hydrolase-fold protein [Geothrix alkalitolerans]|uniref:alpha/beta hydrolase-fold protein n=1 Tax=Geothrix alkalitolerans TaxID=2922724 RepID=UPI001FAFFAF5|nr:alpha/beta hydrolase-fold protein [Geothrix alkalitolerans]